jgi:exodeoxyribonuclease VII large subunit
MQQQAITLTQLNGLIKETLDRNLEPSYWVIAEIGEFRDSVRGHAYLDLIEKSDGGIKAKMRANIWSYSYQVIKRKFESATGDRLRSGMTILALVNIQFHELYGLSLIVKDIDPNFTIGERARRRQEIIDRLQQEGLMELNKQFVLPSISQKIAVISSITAAGYGDFINQLNNNPQNYKVHLKFFQATMQGNQAAASIIAAINQVEQELQKQKFDLLVIIRGGGAQTDMDCFDDYELAKHIANAALPVITGIGHERDESISDMVANTKLKTPTAVASFILSGFSEFEELLRSLSIRMERSANFFMQKEINFLNDKTQLIRHLCHNRMLQGKQQLGNLNKQVCTLARHKINLQRISLENVYIQVRKLAYGRVENGKERLSQVQDTIKRLNPTYILDKGYTKTEMNGRPIHLQGLNPGEEITTFSKDKKIFSTIDKIESYGKKENGNEL